MIVWQAELTKEEWAQVDDDDLEIMAEAIEDAWEIVKARYLEKEPA